jgi:hypothetical protein
MRDVLHFERSILSTLVREIDVVIQICAVGDLIPRIILVRRSQSTSDENSRTYKDVQRIRQVFGILQDIFFTTTSFQPLIRRIASRMEFTDRNLRREQKEKPRRRAEANFAESGEIDLRDMASTM